MDDWPERDSILTGSSLQLASYAGTLNRTVPAESDAHA